MADTMGRSAKAPKKKKALAFLSSISKPAPTFDDFFEDKGHCAKRKEKEELEEDDDDLSLFRRSKDFFPVVVKEQKENPGRGDTTPEPRDDGIHVAVNDEEEEEPIPSSSRSNKRRKLSSPQSIARNPFHKSSDELYGPATPPPLSPSPASRKSHVNQATPSAGKGKGKEPAPSVQSDLLPTPSRSSSHQLSAGHVMVLEDDDDPIREGAPTINPSSPRRAQSKTPPASQDDDRSPTPGPGIIDLADSDEEIDNLVEPGPKPTEDEFAHFIVRAAEKQAAAEAAAAALCSSTEPSDGVTPSATEAVRAGRKIRQPIVAVKIFVHSRLSSIAQPQKYFGVKRGLTQDLGTVRQAFISWMRKQDIQVPDSIEAAIFLTWKGRRIYDSASGVSLGWQPAATGEFPHTTTRVPGFDRGGVLLEAWTEAEFAQYTADQERQRLIDRGELIEEGVAAEDDESQEPAVPKVKVLMQEKDQEPLRLTLWLDTAIRILAGAYRKQRNVPEDREIRLRYEGEWLQPDMTVAEAEIEDMCTVEVYLK